MLFASSTAIDYSSLGPAMMSALTSMVEGIIGFLPILLPVMALGAVATWIIANVKRRGKKIG